MSVGGLRQNDRVPTTTIAPATTPAASIHQSPPVEKWLAAQPQPYAGRHRGPVTDDASITVRGRRRRRFTQADRQQ